MTAFERLPDPFGLTADTAGYVPREATEKALAALVETLREGRRPAALIGPPGLGKTLLLHLVGRRLDHRLRSVYLPYAALPLDELCAWALSLLGFSQSDDTIGDLIQTASRAFERGSALLLLIDDASAMPLPTARKLGDLVAASRGALRLLVAAAEGPSASRMLAATGANVHVVRLLEPMNEAETRSYVEARLARAGIPDPIAARFDTAAIQSIHRLSAGIPRRVHNVASAVLRGRSAESAVDLEAQEPATAAAEPATFDAVGAPAPPPRDEMLAAPAAAASEGGAHAPVAFEPGDTAAGIAIDSQAAREAEVAPALAALREAFAPRPQARVGAPPRARAVFATALALATLGVGIPWLRSLFTPPIPAVASSRGLPAGERASERALSRPSPEQAEPAPGRAAPAAAEAAPPEPPPATATLSVQVNARPWADIEVDGVDLGPTPIAGIPLLAGPHRFRARMPDGRVIEREIDVSEENRFIVFE